MSNKAKKRVISGLDVAVESENANCIGHKTKKGVKKAKLNIDTTQAVNKTKGTQLVKSSSVNNANAPGESKKIKANNSKLGFQVSDATSSEQVVKLNVDKVATENVLLKKKMKQVKEKPLKREKRKQLRKEHGQYKVVGTMTEEIMRKRIDEIQSRENLTKTAKRKLRILKKKLKIAEGAEEAPKTQADDEETPKLTKTQKKKLRREKLKLKNVPQNQDLLNISKAQKEEIKAEFESKKAKVELNNEKLKLAKASNLKKSEKKRKLQKAAQKIKIPTESDEESSEENDDQSESTEDQSEDESLEEILTQTSQLIKEKVPIKMDLDDTRDTEDDDEDDEEGEADDEENESKDDDEEEETDDESIDNNVVNNILEKLPVQKLKKEFKNKKNIIASKISNQENGDKKKRYVLFVGNLPFKATVQDIKQHFLQKVSEVVSVRIPTHKETKKPRGFAYVEVTNNVDYEKALSLHQTTLQGFKINVEYTQTGSKNIKNKQEIVAKNKKLHAIRKAGKLAGSKKESGRRSFRRSFKKNQQG